MTAKEKLSAAEWTAKLRDHEELTHAEKVALTDFIRESPTHVRELIEHTFINEDLKALPIPQSDLDKWIAEARSTAAGTIPFPEKQGSRSEACHREVERVQSHRNSLGRRLLVAASLAAILTIGGVFLDSQRGLYTTGFGEQRILTLADGSVVTLNTESRIRVDFSDKQRTIELQKGEAFFRVAHDAGRPFFVDANNALVRAVGTQFNVKIAPQDTIVSVVDGVVKVSLNKDSSTVSSNAATPGEGQQLLHDERQITLNRGEEARIERHGFTSSAESPMTKTQTPAALHAAAWTQGRLEFEGRPMAEVLSEFQRYRRFDVEIDDAATRQMKLTGSFESHDPDSVLAYIATLPGLNVEQTGPHSYVIHHH
jgi:transmembrane sensor